MPMASSVLEAACVCLQVATLEGQLKETEERASVAEQLLTITQVGIHSTVHRPLSAQCIQLLLPSGDYLCLS